MSSNVWEGAAGARVGGGASGGGVPVAGALPRVFDLVNILVQDVMKNFGGYLLAGLGIALVTLPIVLVTVFLLYAAMFGGMALGLAMDDEIVAMGGMGLGLLGGTLGMAILLIAVTAPLVASLYRAMWAHVVRDEPLGFGAAFSTVSQDIGRIWLYNVILFCLSMAGLFFCYVPALAVGLALHFALPAIVVHRVGIGEAIGLSARHVRDNLGWNLGAWAVGIGLAVVSSQIPFVGMALGYTVQAAWELRLYRAVFGDGETPRVS